MPPAPRETLATTIPALAAAAFLAPVAAAGLTTFWGDLTYLHQAWRAAPAQLVQSGVAPLWEPSLYLGMPMLASMQGGLLYPPTTLYFLFGFATATMLYQFLHLALSGALCALWLRTLRLSWGACAGGALAFSLGGFMVSRLPFLNHLGAVAWMPALLLLFSRPLALAGVLALMFLAGYPTMLPGACLGAWVLAWVLRGRGLAPWPRLAAGWLGAGLLALALSGAQLLPALELTALSRRGAGMSAEEILQWAFSTRDLLQWTSPLLLPWSRFHPEVDWTKTVYLGLFAFAAFLWGLRVVPPGRALGLFAWLTLVVLLTLGASNPLSAALWEPLAALSFVRYPGNLAYMAWPTAALLVAAGLSRARPAAPWALALALELVILARLSTPLAPRGLFTEPGPLARVLQERSMGTRYLLSPRALEAGQGSDVVDWKTRLYGLSNAPYRLRAVGNFGDPLAPADNYAVMDALYRASGAAEAALWMPWVGASRLLTPVPVAGAGRLVPEGRVLWELSVLPGVAMAWQLDAREAAAVPESLSGPPSFQPRRPLTFSRPRHDLAVAAGAGGGWAYVAEPLYPGWSARLEDLLAGRSETAVPRRAFGVFQLYELPQGPWRLRLRYDPALFRLGVLLSLATLLAFGAYWYHRFPRVRNESE